jgi:hypothetical protein
MKKIIVICAALSGQFCANAGPLLETFKTNLNAYISVQAKSLDRPIAYSDEGGQFVRAALNPSQIQPLVAETLQEPDGLNQLRIALDIYKPVATAYQAAFHRFPGKYDAEYIDSFEIMYRMTLVGMDSMKKTNPDEIQDESIRSMTEATIKLMSTVPPLLLGLIEQDINNGRFSSSFVPIVHSRLEAMRTAPR